MIAITKRMWMKPPSVYDVVIPSSHKTTRPATSVDSMMFPFRDGQIIVIPVDRRVCPLVHRSCVGDRITWRWELLDKEIAMITILIVLAVLMLVGALPTWSHSRSWGYGPSGGLGVILVIVLILFLAGRL